jgi:hypothetical protein
MSAIEILAVIFAGFILVKLAIILVAGPGVWLKLIGPVFNSQTPAMIFVAAIAAITGYVVFQHFTVVEVGAVAFFTSFLFALGFITSTFFGPLREAAERMSAQGSTGVFKEWWLAIIVWATLALWILWSVFVA